MKAMLRTACGCTRMIDIPEPAPPEIYVPVREPLPSDYWSRIRDLPPMIDYYKRTFKKDVPVGLPFSSEIVMLYHEDFHP